MATVTISFSMDSAIAARVMTDLCGQFDYTDNALPGETQAAFAKRMVIQDVKNACTAWEATQASNTARDAAIAAVASQIIFT